MKEIVEHTVFTPDGPVQMPVVYEEVPEDAGFEVARSYAGGLPPEEFRLLDPKREKIVTPTDARGVVDTNLLIARVNETIKPEYRYPGASNLHHGQWERAQYVAVQADYPESRAFAFRELAPNKMLIPQVFHNWIHVVTTEPPMPAPEVMRECVQEWVIMKNFFVSVKDAVQTMRIVDRERTRRTFTDEQEDILRRELARKAQGVLQNLEALETVPTEHWPFSPHERMQIAVGKIGDLVLKGRQRRTRDVRRPDLIAA